MKKRLPEIRMAAPNAAARARLAAWLREWNIERALDMDGGAATTPPAAPPRAGRRRAAQAGEVRLLRPDTPAGRSRPRYFLILEVSTARALAQVAPFSRFGTPAIPGEWRTGHPAAPLSVLCLWNRRELPLDGVERSWPVTSFEPERLAAALRAAAGGATPDAAPPDDLADAVGPPLRHPDDPRWRYLVEEAHVWDAVADSAQASTTLPLILESRAHSYGGGSESALPLAAEPKPRYESAPKTKRRKSSEVE